MGETAGIYFTDGRDPQLTQRQYAVEGENNLQRRWRGYDYIPGGNHFMEDFIGALALDASATVVEVGSNSGHNLSLLRKLGHTGTLIGLDVDRRAFGMAAPHVMRRDELNFVAGMAEELPFAKGGVDAFIAPFMLYHVRDYRSALTAMASLLPPGGKIGASTSGPDNKFKHRWFERRIASYLGVDPPPQFNATFDTTIVRAMYAQWHEKLRHNDAPATSYSLHMYEEENVWMRFDHTTYHVYLESLASMRSAFQPAASALDDRKWLEAIESQVVPVIEEEIVTRGCFTDKVARSYLIYTKGQTKE